MFSHICRQLLLMQFLIKKGTLWRHSLAPKSKYMLNLDIISIKRPILDLDVLLYKACQDLKLYLKTKSLISLKYFRIIDINELLYRYKVTPDLFSRESHYMSPFLIERICLYFKDFPFLFSKFFSPSSICFWPVGLKAR